MYEVPQSLLKSNCDISRHIYIYFFVCVNAYFCKLMFLHLSIDLLFVCLFVCDMSKCLCACDIHMSNCMEVLESIFYCHCVGFRNKTQVMSP